MASFSRTLEQTLHRALSLAGAKKHEFATLEHLLFALTEDQDAIAVMRACNVDVDKLRERVGAFIDEDLRGLVVSVAQDARSEEHTSELQSLMRTSYAVFCLTKKKHISRMYK